MIEAYKLMWAYWLVYEVVPHLRIIKAKTYYRKKGIDVTRRFMIYRNGPSLTYNTWMLSCLWLWSNCQTQGRELYLRQEMRAWLAVKNHSLAYDLCHIPESTPGKFRFIVRHWHLELLSKVCHECSKLKEIFCLSNFGNYKI